MSAPASSRVPPRPFAVDFDKKSPYTTIHFRGYQFYTMTKPLFEHEGFRKLLTTEQPNKNRNNTVNRFMDCDKDVYEPIASWLAHHIVDLRKVTIDTLNLVEKLKVMDLLSKIKHCWIVNIGVTE